MHQAINTSERKRSGSSLDVGDSGEHNTQHLSHLSIFATGCQVDIEYGSTPRFARTLPASRVRFGSFFLQFMTVQLRPESRRSFLQLALS